jgi:hypothetical protein
MRKQSDSKDKETKEDLLRKFERIEFHQDTDIDRYVDVQMNEKIKEQLRDIDDQIEVIGKVCDNQYKKSYNMLKNILDKESEKIDTGIKNYISNLREQLVNFKTRLNFDYKGKYTEISKQLNNTVEKLKKNKEEKTNLENKFNVLNEDEQFYQRQLDNLKDMNIYLKYKLKLLLKDYDALNNYNLGYQNQEDEKENNVEDNKDNEEPPDENRPQNNVVQQRPDNYFITGLNEYEERDDSPNDNNINQDNGNNLNNQPNGKFSDEQIQKVYSRLIYIRGKLYNNIENENIEYSNLKQVFDKLYFKTNNIYMNILKNTHNEQKLNNSSTTGNNNNSSITNNNQSTLPSIYQSTNSSRNVSKRSYKPKEGYMTKKQNKDLIIKFLENDEIKKIIYKMLYDD